MSNFNKYPSYKDSGSPWFPTIPAHWEVLPNRYIFDLKKSQVGKKSNQYKLLSLTLNGVIERDMENPSGKFPAEFDTYQEVKKGDFIFCLFDVEETPRTVGLSEFDGMITGAYTVFRNRLAQNAKYLYYFFLSLDEKKRLKPLYKGLRNTISKENFYSFKTSLPPLSEQTAIANFLDKKTAEIKEFIALKEKTIELLKERKMAIINQAVTKGLDPTVEMKDSGIEWLGEIPKHWEKVRIGHYVNVFRGASPRPAGDPTLFGGDFMPWITVSEVTKKGEKYLIETETYLTRLGAKQSRTVLPEMLLLSNSGASLGVPKITLIKGCFNDGSVAFDKYNYKLQRDFLYHFFNSHTEIYRREMAGYGQPNLNTDIIKSTKIPLPPIDEQRSICIYIDSKTEEFNEIIKQTEKEIELIKEYQQSLISEVVTGKVDVIK